MRRFYSRGYVNLSGRENSLDRSLRKIQGNLIPRGKDDTCSETCRWSNRMSFYFFFRNRLTCTCIETN